MLDETMSMHGSMWFMPANYYRNNLQGLDTNINTSNSGDGEEIILKTWLGGGKVMVNKNTWYAHLQDVTATDRLWPDKFRDSEDSCRKLAEYWTDNEWNGQIYSFDWLIDRFWPLPTQSYHHRRDRYLWPENWKELYSKK